MQIIFENNVPCKVVASNDEIIEFFIQRERLCDCCCFQDDGCDGCIHEDEHGLSYPACTDYFSERFIKPNILCLVLDILKEEQKQHKAEAP